MRAQPSISPLTLGLCCATIAGALALAPGRGPLPDGHLRGADILALEAARDGQSAATGSVRPDEVADDGVDGTSTADVEPSADREPGTDTSCGGDCAEAPTVLSVGAAETDVAADRDGVDGGQSTDALAGESAGAAGAGDTGGTDGSGDGATEDHACRSPRAEAASPHGQPAAAAPSPCSRGHGHDGCQGSDCMDGRSRGTAEA